MKKQGMIWYNMLKFIVPVGVLWNVYLLWVAAYQLSQGAAPMHGMPYSVGYCVVCMLSALMSIVVIAKMTVDLWRKSVSCAKSALTVIITCAACRCAITFAACVLVPFPSYADAVSSFVWCIFCLLLFWMPTYMYLRKRSPIAQPIQSPAPAAASEEQTGSQPAFCRKCGKPLRKDSEFCEYCGQRTK